MSDRGRPINEPETAQHAAGGTRHGSQGSDEHGMTGGRQDPALAPRDVARAGEDRPTVGVPPTPGNTESPGERRAPLAAGRTPAGPMRAYPPGRGAGPQSAYPSSAQPFPQADAGAAQAASPVVAEAATPAEAAAGTGLLRPETRAAIAALRDKYPQVQSAVLDALRLAQAERGYLPAEAIGEVGEILGVSPHHLSSLATFYTMYFTEPVGRYVVEVCDNLSCALWGSRRLLAQLEAELGVAAGETTPDGSVTLLRTIECLAACGGAPALRVNTTYREKLTDADVPALVAALRTGTFVENS